MSDNIFANVYRTVTSQVRGYKDSPIDTRTLQLEQAKIDQSRREQEAFKKNQALIEAKERYDAFWEAKNAPVLLENARKAVLNQVYREAPDFLLAEAFTHIYLNSLVHERPYVLDNYKAYKSMGYMYIRKLGGISALRTAVKENRTPFLVCMLTAIEESSKKLLKNRTDKAVKCMSEQEVRDTISPRPTDDERNELVSKIDELGADELAQLVQDKIKKVCCDEKLREKDEKEFLSVLQDDLKDAQQTSIAANSTGTDDKTVPTDEGDLKPDSAGQDVPTTTKESMSLEHLIRTWDPIRGTNTYKATNEASTLFKAMLCNIHQATLLEGSRNHKPNKPTKHVLTNPLNLNVFEQYLDEQNPNRGKYVEDIVTESDLPTPPTGDVLKEKVFSEVLSQYTLLEVAHTMRLINVDQTMIAQQSKFLMDEHKVFTWM